MCHIQDDKYQVAPARNLITPKVGATRVFYTNGKSNGYADGGKFYLPFCLLVPESLIEKMNSMNMFSSYLRKTRPLMFFLLECSRANINSELTCLIFPKFIFQQRSYFS